MRGSAGGIKERMSSMGEVSLRDTITPLLSLLIAFDGQVK